MALKNKEQVDLVLETLSFFEPMSLEKIIFDFDKDKIEKMKDFSKDDLEAILEHLVKKKKVKVLNLEKGNQYIKIQKKASGLKKLFSFFKK